MFAARPGPEVREAANFWVEEEHGDFAMRIGIEGLSELWDSHEIWLDIAFPDGRVLSSRERFASHSPLGADGRPTVLGTGPLRMECVEPFRHWSITFADHPVTELSARQLIDGDLPADAPERRVSFRIDVFPAVPPLVSGTLTAQSRALMQGEQGTFISPRFEQLCRAEGTLTIDGQTRAFRGQSLRIKRQGVRKFEGFQGHCWMSALFPGGRAFGVNLFPPRPDGLPSFNEGFLFDGDGPLRPARAVQAPWLRRLVTGGEAVPLVLETEDGERIAIAGTTFVNCRSRGHKTLPTSFPIVQQAHARYRWGDEEATGMIERSTLPDRMERP
jgi:hypothetical protein